MLGSGVAPASLSANFVSRAAAEGDFGRHVQSRRRALEHFLEHHGSGDRVDRRVALDLVHRLAHADRRREVDDGVDAVESLPDGVVKRWWPGSGASLTAPPVM